MARIPVDNPPGKLTRPRLYKRKKRFYRGPKSTLKAHMTLANPKRKKRKFKRKAHRRRSSVSRRVKKIRVHRRHRKAVARSRKTFKKIHRRKRHHKRTHFNPFGSDLIMMNPTRRHRRKKRMARHKRRHHRRRHSLMNPFSASGFLSKPKEMFTKEFALEAVATAGGFMAPNLVMNYLPVGFRDSKLKFYGSKILVISGIAAATSMVSKKASRFVLIGGGVSLLLDLWAEWQARSKAPAPAAGTSAYYGENVGAYYGEGSGMGDDLVLTDSPQGAF